MTGGEGPREGWREIGTNRKLSNQSFTCPKPSLHPTPPPHFASLLPLVFSISLPLCNHGAASPPWEGVDDVIVSAGISRVSVAIPVNWCRQPLQAHQTNMKRCVSHHREQQDLDGWNWDLKAKSMRRVFTECPDFHCVFLRAEMVYCKQMRWWDRVCLHAYKVWMLTRGNWFIL